MSNGRRRMKTLRCFLVAVLVIFLCLLAAMILTLTRDERYHKGDYSVKLPGQNEEGTRRSGRSHFTDFVDVEESQWLKIFLPEPEKNRHQRPKKARLARLKIHKSTNEDKDTPCVRLDTHNGTSTPICIYPPSRDKMMSSFINDYHTWEREQLVAMAATLETDASLGLLDLGCSLGVYTLYAATMHRHVVAVDALRSNLDLLARSLTLGGLHENVTLVQNAVSDTHERLAVTVPEDGNVGGTYVSRLSPATGEHSGKPLVDAILLDDLIPLLKARRLFVKMDIEGSEVKALRGAARLFQTLDVRYVLMEWMLHRYHQRGAEVISFMLRNGLLPYTDVSKTTFLQPDKYAAWPDNVFWIKR